MVCAACRYDNALRKANYAALALKPTDAGEEEEDPELQEALSRARRAAAKQRGQAEGTSNSAAGASLEALAEGLAVKREADEAETAQAIREGESSGSMCVTSCRTRQPSHVLGGQSC